MIPPETLRLLLKSPPSPELLFLFVLLLVGCGLPAPAPSESRERAATPVFDWNSAVEQVRSGNVRRIEASRYAVPEAEWQMLATGCDLLEILEVDNTSVASESLIRILEQIPAVKRLKLMGPAGDAELRAIARLERLEILNLPQGQFSDEALQDLKGHSRLQLLRFSSPAVGDAGLAMLTTLPSLRFLHLIDVPITDAALEHLIDCPKLESFYLDGGHCTEDGLSALIRRMPKLHFHWNQLHLRDDPQAHPHP